MKFFFDESGNFQLPPSGEHRAGIVSGITISEEHEEEIFRRFDKFVSELPPCAFKNGEPKGRLLDDVGRRAYAEMLADLPGILICPIMLDLTSLVGTPQDRIADLVSENLRALQAKCKHQSLRDEIGKLANEVGVLSTQQCLRLAAWAKCISRTINDSIIHHSGRTHESSWNALRFEIDPVEQLPGNREERVFEIMLPMWITSWSQENPFTLVEDVHTAEHPVVKNWSCDDGLDVEKCSKKTCTTSRQVPARGFSWLT